MADIPHLTDMPSVLELSAAAVARQANDLRRRTRPEVLPWAYVQGAILNSHRRWGEVRLRIVSRLPPLPTRPGSSRPAGPPGVDSNGHSRTELVTRAPHS